jgi:hypothetical protein
MRPPVSVSVPDGESPPSAGGNAGGGGFSPGRGPAYTSPPPYQVNY